MFIKFPEVSGIIMQEKEVSLPRMVTVQQKYATQKIEDITVHIRREMEILAPKAQQFCGKRIAITSGSRGIPHIDEITCAVCDVLLEWGG